MKTTIAKLNTSTCIMLCVVILFVIVIIGNYVNHNGNGNGNGNGTMNGTMTTVADALWKMLFGRGVDCVFGLPGGPLIHLLEAKPDNISWVNLGCELQNAFAAGAYGEQSVRGTGAGVGVTIATTGPGVGTAFSGLKAAMEENKPVMLVSAFQTREENNFQFWNVEKLVRELTDDVFIVKESDDVGLFVSAFDNAYRAARDKRHLSVLLIEPSVFVKKCVVDNIESRDGSEGRDAREGAWVAKKISSLVGGCGSGDKRKVLFVLDMCSGNSDDMVNALRRCAVPYVTTWDGRIVRNDIRHLYQGRLGSLGHHQANYAIAQATHIVVIGDDTGNVTKDFYSELFGSYNVIDGSHTAIIKVVGSNGNGNGNSNNILSWLGLSSHRHFVIPTGDWSAFFNGLSFKCDDIWLSGLNKMKPSLMVLSGWNKPATPIEKCGAAIARVYNSVSGGSSSGSDSSGSERSGSKITIASGVGNHWLSVGKYLETDDLDDWVSANTWASIGVGVPYGVGACLARSREKGRHIWVVEGDGGSWFSACALWYLVANPELPITITIIDNGQYGMVETSMEDDVRKGNADDSLRRAIKDTTRVVSIDFGRLLPNALSFYNVADYEEYLRGTPVSDSVRFLIVHVPGGETGDSVFGFDMDEKYVRDLHSGNIAGILSAKDVAI